MREVILASGLHAGSKNNQKIYLYENDYLISASILEKILGDNVRIVYDESKNIIKAYFNITDYEERNTFLTIDMTTGNMSGKTMNGVQLDDELITVMPIKQSEEIFLPLKSILNRVKAWDSNIYCEENLGILRLHLEDFEVDFLNDFPYSVVGNYVSNSVVSYSQAINISKAGVIYKKDNKYGLVSYNVEEYKENTTQRGKYLGYTIDIEANYDEIEFVPYDYSMYILKRDSKSIIYNRENKTLSEEYDMIEEIKNGEHNYKVKKNGKYGIYGVSEIIYDDIWYEQGETTGTTTQYTTRGIYGSLNGERILLKELRPNILEVD